MKRDTKALSNGRPGQGVRHAVQTAKPYVASAGEGAARGARQAGAYVAPRARRAAVAAREGYDERLAPRLRQAAAAAGPAGREARVRSGVAMAALRGDLTPRDLRCAVRRRERRARARRTARRLTVLGLVAGGAFLAWKWWERQSSPEWLMEPSPATEVPPEEMQAEAEQMQAEMDADAQREAG
ncbi:DUF5324 family protein [Streptomyces sp. 6N223]|uniref:DUF5324 family protein n=1 Tax=Streptomyces sp. 6N223 TaxID=3457412 RepID=UPI003FD2A240